MFKMDFKSRINVKIRDNSEYYRVYNKKGKYIKDIDVQDEKQLTDEYLYGVTCFVINEKGEVLMEVRANTELTPEVILFSFLEATSFPILRSLFLIGSLISTSFTTVTPSFMVDGAPNFLSIITLLPLEQSVIFTAPAI